MTSRSSENQPPDKINIYYVWDYLEWGGAQIYFFGLMNEAKKRWRVSAVLPEKSAPRLFDDLNRMQVPAITFAAHTDISAADNLKRKLARRCNKFVSELTLLRRMRKLDLSNSLVQIDLAPWHSFWAVLYLILKSKSVVQTLHTPLDPVSQKRTLEWTIKMRLLNRFANYRLLTSNEKARESLKHYLTPLMLEKVRVSYSGINRAEINAVLAQKESRAGAAQKFGIPAKNVWVICVGQFIERKGCWILLEAAQKVLRDNPNVTFLWLNTVNADSVIRARIKEYAVGDNFKLLAPADFGGTRRDLLGLTAQADVFALASFQEGLPVALCEAMALGLPPISTTVGAIPEAIENDANGLLVKPGDAQMLAEAVNKLVENPDWRGRLAEAAQKTAFEKFDQAIAAQVTLAAYSELCGEN